MRHCIGPVVAACGRYAAQSGCLIHLEIEIIKMTIPNGIVTNRPRRCRRHTKSKPSAAGSIWRGGARKRSDGSFL